MSKPSHPQSPDAADFNPEPIPPTGLDGVRPYHHAAGGWGALRAVATHLARQRVIAIGTETLLRANQPQGFDCPGCAWPDSKHTSSFEFCENGAKAVAWEATANRVTKAFFERHTVSELRGKSDYWLESQGRLTEPMRYDAASDHYLPISWDEAFGVVATHLKQLGSPNEAEFYTSGRASNEAAFLFQLMARTLGTNNFPDCSNMCHEPTSVGLPRSIGVGKGTVTLEDFEYCDAIFSFGHNPGTNHPRMMGTLHEASRRGADIVVFNPLRERALERFSSPQDPIEMAAMTSTPISSQYHQVKVGGDVGALKGVMKALLATQRELVGRREPGIFDLDFIEQHCIGYDDFIADLDASSWESIERSSGLQRDALESAAKVYAKAKAVIVTYGMGITQHRTGTANVRYLMNLLLLRGNIGRQGAGICPLRGHSNVQGNRTVGITERPGAPFLDLMEKVFKFEPPRDIGHSVVDTIESIRDGKSRVLIALGGNFAQATPDPDVTHPALSGLALFVGINTKLNRSHLTIGRDALILPCLGRTERDDQAGGIQSITVEDSMSQVHASMGLNEPASQNIRSEIAIIAGMAKATFGNVPVDWDACTADYGVIRDYIEAVLPIFRDYNARIRIPGGFRLQVKAGERIWDTESKRAAFYVYGGVDEDELFADRAVLRLTTLRSHDQYNTTIYGLDDRYRGIFGRRDVLLMNAADMKEQGIVNGTKVRVDSATSRKCVEGWTVVEYDLPRGSCAAYYPEANVLVALEDRDPDCLTPAYKSAPVRVTELSQAMAGIEP